MPEPKMSFVSFGDRSCRGARKRLAKQAKESGYFDSINILAERDLGKDFRKRNLNRLAPGSRGFGYWMWKPQVILQELEKLGDGDVLLYADVGCHIVPDRGRGLERYVTLVRNSPSGLLCGELSHLESAWTKGDLFDFFGVREATEITDTPQRIGTVIFFVRNQTSLEIVRAWLGICEKNPDLISDAPSLSPNFPDFQEHRHDQSVLSILSKLRGCSTFSAAEIEKWRQPHDEAIMQDFPIEARRDRFSSSRKFRSRIKSAIVGISNDFRGDGDVQGSVNWLHLRVND